MSSSRLLILGVMRIFQPVHGYEIKRELESWRAGSWADIAYGSIYHALKKMSEQGMIEAASETEIPNRPAKTSYRVTEIGEAEFQRLLREHWWDFKPAIDPFQVALAFMNHMPRDELLAALHRRAGLLRLDLEANEWAARLKIMPPEAPRHVAENMNLAASHSEAELQWTESVIEKVERGDLP